MNSLPQELVDMIVCRCPYKDLPNLRLTTKALSSAATKLLFSLIHVTNQDESTQTAFHCILKSPKLKSNVKTVKFASSRYSENRGDYGFIEEESRISETFAETFRAVSGFPNLQAIELDFMNVCYLPHVQPSYPYQAKEPVNFCASVLATLFSSLKSIQETNPRFRSLKIDDLHNFNVQSFAEMENFVSVLSKLGELRLRIAMDEYEEDEEPSWGFPVMHDFFHNFPSTWLKPASANLQNLTIYCDTYWGYIPKCDLRSVHFPKLRKLELGNFSFSHDWQLDWILSHGKTLKELVLDNCFIVAYSYNLSAADAENYPIDPMDVDGQEHLWAYPRSWTDYFSAFQAQLPSLKVFRFGKGRWCNRAGLGRRSKWEYVLGEGFSSTMYMAFNRAIGPPPWHMVDEMMLYLDEEVPKKAGIVIENVMEKYRDQDYEAYCELIDVLDSRQRRSIRDGWVLW